MDFNSKRNWGLKLNQLPMKKENFSGSSFYINTLNAKIVD